jgi:type IV pilus assembly protein PilO
VSALAEPRVLARTALGLLLLANLVAAAFAFHLFGASPQALEQSLTSAIAERQAAQVRLKRSRMLTGSVEKGKSQSETFLATYMSSRRHTYSLIVGEITSTAKTAGMKMGDTNFAPLDPIEGSEDLDMLTISVNLEGGYNELKKFVNLLDRSPRFLIIESLTVAPRPKGDVLLVNFKLNTFVREDKESRL